MPARVCHIGKFDLPLVSDLGFLPALPAFLFPFPAICDCDGDNGCAAIE